jgi:WD40 repeat protein
MKCFVQGVVLAALVWPSVTAADEPQTFTPETGGAGVRALAFSPDGKTLAVGARGFVNLLDATTGKSQRRFGFGDSRYINTVAFSPDGSKLASGGGESQEPSCEIDLWKVALGGLWGTLREPNLDKQDMNKVLSLAYSPDGKTLVSAGGDNSRYVIKLWDVTTLKKRATLTTHMLLPLCVAYSRDGKMLASSGRSAGQINEGKPCAIDLWDAATGKERAILKGHTGAVYSVAFGKDGKTLASAGSDETIKLWDVATHKERATLKGDAGEVYSLAFSPDGMTLASANENSTIKLWDVATGKELTTLNGHKSMVLCLAYSPDGMTLASGSGDNTIKLWRVSVDPKLPKVIQEEKK